MTEQEVFAVFASLLSDFRNLADMPVEQRPLLAHYTSLEVMSKIVENEEIWFSNPLFMNDHQEVRFGMLNGRAIFDQCFDEPSFVASIDPQMLAIIKRSFHHLFEQFDKNELIDYYVLCLTEHPATQTNGLLSMWRAYGGNGHGAALVFNTSFVTVRQGSPLLIGEVKYDRDEARRLWMHTLMDMAKAAIQKATLDDQTCWFFGWHIFQSLVVYAVFSKHEGFREEKEYRVLYHKNFDQLGLLTDKISYIVGSQGVEPKLHFPMKPLAFEEPESWSFDSILNQIILGPGLAPGLAQNAVNHMFDNMKPPRSHLKARTSSSQTPYRPR